jgi:hypothetical protein
MLEKLDLPEPLLRFLFRHRLRQPFAFLAEHHVFVADFSNHDKNSSEQKNLREARGPELVAGLIPDAPAFFRARANKND